MSALHLYDANRFLKQAEIAAAPAALEGKTEMDAMIAYLQSLGTNVKIRR